MKGGQKKRFKKSGVGLQKRSRGQKKEERKRTEGDVRKKKVPPPKKKVGREGEVQKKSDRERLRKQKTGIPRRKKKVYGREPGFPKIK